MKTIVVVDDEFGLADVLAATLSDVGYRVVTAANGLQGLEAMAAQPPDLVILDYMMPLLDGPGVLDAMRKDPRFAGAPVVMMSAMPEPVVAARCSGYAVFLRKPFDFDEVLAAIRTSLGEHVP
ncbi:MAG TPA: response regulator [Polyangiaceae bacterium]|jgi:DNA-binding response OmpR family regulator|nr:response regulator [Polyangiaceae bacterium]